MNIPFKKKSKKAKQASPSKGLIKIKVYMRFGAEIRQLRATFLANEKKDNYNTLVAINEKTSFKEELDFTQEDVYSTMNITLGVAGLTTEEALKKIAKREAKLEKRISALEKHPELNKFANVWDEKRKLRQFKIYSRYLTNRSEHGTYFKMEEGLRIYEYESVDGFLIPIWHGIDNLSDYPDFTTKKKITMQETANIQAYFDGKGSKKLMINALLMVILITSALFLVNVYGGFKLLDKHQELEDRMVEGTEYCSEQFQRTTGLFNTVMDNAFIKQYLDEKEAEQTAQNEGNVIQKLIP